jgi:hypothetical protein
MSDLEQALAAIQKDKERRQAAVSAEIEAALLLNRCQLRALPQLTEDGRIVAVLVIEAL